MILDEGADEYGIPTRIFGAIDPRLPAMLGRVVMLSALLERKIAAIASSVENKPQDHYDRASLTNNAEVCKDRFPLFDRSPYEIRTIDILRRFIDEVMRVSTDRNELVHRVWSVASGEMLGGHKAPRSRRPSRRGKAELGGMWRNYDAAEIQELIDQMVELVDQAREIVPLATSLPRIVDAPKSD